MQKVVSVGFLLAIGVLFLPPISFSQNGQDPIIPPFARGERRVEDDRPRSFREQQSKLRIDRERKEHAEMVKRGEEALTIAERLENALAQDRNFASEELRDLAELEKVVAKIRKDLGGGGDKENEKFVEEELGKTTDVREAFLLLHKTTSDLMSELKKTTRFTISASAIQASNTVISITKFLRLRKR